MIENFGPVPGGLVAGTGHRDLPDGSIRWLHDQAATVLADLVAYHGVTGAATGLARGWDLLWGEEILARPGLPLHAYWPHQQQAALWCAADRRRWTHLAARAARIVEVWKLPGNEDRPGEAVQHRRVRLLHARNEAMLDTAGLVVACWDGRKNGGTWRTVRSARRRRLPIVQIDPARRTVTTLLPQQQLPIGGD